MDQQDNIYQNLDSGFLVKDEQGRWCSLSDGNLKVCQEKERPVSDNDSLVTTAYNRPELQPPPLAVMKSGSSFYFHPQDEEEADQHLEKTKLGDQPQYSIEKIVSKLAQLYNLSTPDQLKKIKEVAFAFLRDRRSLIETRQILLESINLTNLSLAAIDEMINFLLEVKQEITSKKGLIVEEKDSQVLKSKSDNLKPMPSVANNQSNPKKLEPIITEIPVPLVTKDNQPPKPVEVKNTEPTAAELEARTIADSQTFKPNFNQAWPALRSTPVGKSMMFDVKREQKLVGPVDELSTMNLLTFRRISTDPKVAVAKISQKITNLGQESLSRKTKAISAWRSSDVYRQYLSIGQASMENSVQVSQIIEQLKNSGQEVMTMAEFEAIGDLNRSLRY